MQMSVSTVISLTSLLKMSWEEVETAKKENRREIILSGKKISERIDKHGLDKAIFDLTNLNYLNIHETSLEAVPEEISKLENLQTLVLHSNKLKNVTATIALLEKLKILDLSRNSLKEIPEEFVKLSQLVTLNVSFNELEKLPPFTNSTKLATLDASNNKFKEFPDICHLELTSLAEIKLSNNVIEEIPSGIGTLSNLKTLEVSHNKIKSIPAEVSDCTKLKEVNFKDNPISDRRLLKLIDQCRTKQVLDYIKQHCTRTVTKNNNSSNKNKKNKTQSESSNKSDDNDRNYMFNITVKHCTDESLKITVEDTVRPVRQFIVGCLVHNLEFDEQLFRKFIQLQTKLHDSVCEKRNAATIATHDAKKLATGNLVYTAKPPSELQLQPLNRSNTMTGAELYARLKSEAEALRKEKKRNVYSGVHKYLYLLEGQSKYPCLLDALNRVISFPPITNSDISKISVDTTSIFIEVTSSTGVGIARKVMDTTLKEMVVLFGKNLTVQQVKNVDVEGNMKFVYPSRADLEFDDNVSIKIVRE